MENRIPTHELEAMKARRRAVAELYDVLPPEHQVILADLVQLRLGVPLDAAQAIVRRVTIRAAVLELESRERFSDEERCQLKELQAKIGALLARHGAHPTPPQNTRETLDGEA